MNKPKYHIGQEVGEVCNREDCKGVIEEHEKEGSCSCHINPPCGVCTTNREYCPECNWSGEEEYYNSDSQTQNSYNRMMDQYEARINRIRQMMRGELPITELEYYALSHTHFTMIKEGVYPEGMTSQEVYKEVQGTFGGRFERFDSGRFKFIAYTD